MTPSRSRQSGDTPPLRDPRQRELVWVARCYPAAARLRLIVSLLTCSLLAAAALWLISAWMNPDPGRNVGGRPLLEWVALLGDSDSKLRNEAVEVLIEVGSEAAPFVHRALADRNVQCRRDAALVLQKIRPTDRASAAALANALYDQDRWVRWRAAQTLRNMGPAAKDAVLPLSSALADVDPVVRLAAAQALGEIGKPAILAHPALLEAMQDQRVFVRRAATSAMQKIMPGQGDEPGPTLKVEY